MRLLKDLYEIFAPSGGEKKIKKFIKRWVSDNVADVIIRKDNNDGNVYITKGKAESYPCVVAHLDQVQRNHSADFIAVETEDIIFGYSPSNRRREGLGADDKNGIWVALRCLEEFDNIKVAFFVGEEVGCVGSGRADISWFKDCQFIIEPDRRGRGDLITSISGRICSSDFEDAIPYEQYGYKPTSGMMTDVLELTDRGVGISCINLSCGYYDPHTDDESTVKEDLYNCLNLVRHIIAVNDRVFPHTRTKETYASSSPYGWTNQYKYGYGGCYDYDYADFWSEVDNGEKTTTTKEPTLAYMSEFADLEAFVDQLIWMNCEWFTPQQLYPYVASDLELYGVSKEQFLELAECYYEYYLEDKLSNYYGYQD